jgi:hypothetical protein
MHSGHLGKSWDQQGVMNIESINGVYKVKITSYGKYRITLCRYPLESGYKINQHVPAMKKSTEVVSPLTESDSIKLVKSHLYIADIEGAESIKNVNENDCGVSYESCFYEGKYDMQAFFTDDKGINYPAYYIYIEKL